MDETYVVVRIKGETILAMVDDSGRARVWDDAGRIYTSRHELSERELDAVREQARRNRE